ncbi:hypothetical protein [Aureivirga sp. CE67]|uniref:hypothetical protein n=1 Tax=Aureivirga sp. CE67 TaxID=1788983 RepID=UPI0018C99C37|nr:hypothetical protein [Aureivirga sp. CE67]
MKKKLLSVMLVALGINTGIAQTFNEDVKINGSLGIGMDIGTPSFGFDTFVMKENNLRILFDDTSATANFAANDWRITINDTENGGANYFSIDDVTGNKRPFYILAGAKNNSLYLGSNGHVGFGTSNPAMELHTVTGDTPTLRLEQDNSSGWGAYTWDIAGNETNFFIRDVGNGKLPFKIFPGNNNNVLNLKNSRVGVNTTNPSATLHVNGVMRLQNTAAPETANAGDIYFDSEDSKFKAYDGTNWHILESNTDNQDLSLNENVLSLTNDDSTVDLSAYLDNTDAQNLTLENTVIGISNGNTVDLSPFMDNTDNQDLSLDENILSLTNDDSTVDLSAYLDNTDSQNLGLDSNELSISNGNTVDLSSYLDNTDSQNLGLDSNELSISNGNSVNLSTYLDNTDNQDLSLNENTLSLTNDDSSVDLSSFMDNTDDQILMITGNNLEIENGNTVSLENYLDNTDEQNLEFSGSELTISNGNTVDLAGLLTTVNENISSLQTTVSDLENQVETLSDSNIELTLTVENLEEQLTIANEKIAVLEDCACQDDEGDVNVPEESKIRMAMLYQNTPNPYESETKIKFYIPKNIDKAYLRIKDNSGKNIQKIELHLRGENHIVYDKGFLASGVYFYSLYVDGVKADTKRMIVK